MKVQNEFIALIRDRCEGRPYDVESYVTRMDDLMASVYATRYGSLSPRPTEGGALTVDFESFRNVCWERIEDEGLVFKFYNATTLDDAHLKAYIWKSFENLLQDRMSALSPGFRTRMKQVSRVLCPRTLDSCRKFCDCWKLRSFRDKSPEPADVDRLLAASGGLTLPKLHAPKNPESERCPWISDTEMARYLVLVLENAGGMTTRAHLRSFMTVQYGLQSVRRATDPPKVRDGEEENADDAWISRMAMKNKRVLLGPDHMVMARELAEGMNDEMKEVFFLRVIREWTLEQVALEMGKSVGTIHNMEKRYTTYFIRYFSQSEAMPIPEEEAGVLALVSELILEMRETP